MTQAQVHRSAATLARFWAAKHAPDQYGDHVLAAIAADSLDSVSIVSLDQIRMAMLGVAIAEENQADELEGRSLWDLIRGKK